MPTTPIVQNQAVTIPDSYFVAPCDVHPPGFTPRELGVAYAENSSCIFLFRERLETIKNYQLDQKKIIEGE